MSDEFNRQMVIVSDAACLATILDSAGSKRERLYAAMLKLYPEEDWFWPASDIYADCVSHNDKVLAALK